MKHIFKSILLTTFSLFIVTDSSSQSNTKSPTQSLFYTTPAMQWVEALPLGNGRLGMMPDGGIIQERIVLNEISMWSGSVTDYSNPDAAQSLPQIRQLLFDGKNKEAQELMYSSFVPKKSEKGGTYGAYQMLANLDINYIYGDSSSIHSYERGLDLQTSLGYTDFTEGKYQHKRRYIASRARDLLLVNITTDNPDGISLAVSINRPTPKGEQQAIVNSEHLLELTGALDSGVEGVSGVEYATFADAFIAGEKGNKITKGHQITVEGANDIWIVVSAATSFFEKEDYKKRALRILQDIIDDDLNEIAAEQEFVYQGLYQRANLDISGNPQTMYLPTDERILAFQSEDDPALAALYYNYGRYLLISSTRPGSLPPNLQGLWANDTITPWNGDYHTNINVQMNHWPAEPANLSELHLPLIDLTKGLVISGERSAKAFYGKEAKGWVAHMMTNVWQYTEPGEHPSWGATNTGGAWLCAHLWEHYLYNNDSTYLASIYPTMKGASEFFLSTMVVDPATKYLVTAPSSSPENEFYLGDDKTRTSVCMGPTMDTQIIKELFENVIETSKILGIDSEYQKSLQEACKQLPPMLISKEGYLQEWLKDYKEVDPHHRHVSHLYGLHPGNQISTSKTPQLAEACKETLNRRGDEGTGWSRAWKINFWARLGDGDRAYKLFKSLLSPAYLPTNPYQHTSGTFPNLFCSHPPFQIDGNWGGTAGISEMVIQSQNGYIEVLPALPSSWTSGKLKGFRVRGGATVDLVWEDGVPSELLIQPDETGTFHLKNTLGTVVIDYLDRAVVSKEEIVDLQLNKGEKTKVVFSKE